jgi:hypothetical protein
MEDGMFKKLIVIALFLILPIICLGASSQTETHITDLPGDVDIWTIAWTGHTDGTYTSYTTLWNVDGYVFMVVTDPGATAPDDNYTVALTDSDGVDVMGGEMADCDTANTEQFVPKIGATVYGTRFVKGPLVISIGDNTANGSGGEIIIYIWGGK